MYNEYDSLTLDWLTCREIKSIKIQTKMSGQLSNL